MATSSRKRKKEGLGDVASLVRALRSYDVAQVPLLVVRVRDIERIAWRKGRSSARSLERRCLQTFVETAERVLRANDLLAHDEGSADFLAALVSPTRTAGAVATPTDRRATLARLASAMESSDLKVETGWTVLDVSSSGDSRLERAIAEALERGARERERYDFFSTIGHELRTPLTSIRGYLETLLDQDLDPSTARRFLEVARAEANRMGRLVEGLFDLSLLDLRTDVARVEGVREETCDLASAIAAAADALGPFASSRNIRVVVQASDERHVALGRDRLTQILINVLENAIKYGREGGRVQVSAAPLDGRYVEVCVDDDGPGVLPEEREEIFALTRRGSNARGRGAGIGLAVVRLMLERVEGEVDVVASPLGGARFRLRLPLGE